MVTSGPAWLPRNQLLVGGLMISLLSAALLLILLFAPRDAVLSDGQRLAYLHVSVVWWGLAACGGLGLGSLLYLVRRDLGWDYWAQAATETGWLCSTLALLTGMMWVRETQNAWWRWDGGLTGAFLLWCVYGLDALIRVLWRKPHRRARASALCGLLGLGVLATIVLAAGCFQGLFPGLTDAAPRDRLVLLLSAVAFAAFFAFLTMQRRWQLGLEAQVATLEWRIDRGARVRHLEDV